MSVPMKLKKNEGIWVPVGSSNPASNNNTENRGSSDNRDATVAPALPPPITTKSYLKIKTNIFYLSPCFIPINTILLSSYINTFPLI